MDESARGPVELAAAEQVDVKVRNGFSAVGTVVDHDAITGGEIELAGQVGCGEQQVAEQGLVGERRLVDPGNGFLGYDQNMNGRLRLNVVNGDAVLVLVGDLGGDFASDDFFEERHGWGFLLQEETEETE